MMDLSQMSSTIQHQNRRRIYSHICCFTHVYILPAVTVDVRYLSLASNPSSPLGGANKYGSCCSMRCAYTAGCRSIGAGTLTCVASVMHVNHDEYTCTHCRTVS